MSDLLRTSDYSARTRGSTTVIDASAHRVLRNTYLLLSLCLAFAAVAAGVAAALGLPYPGALPTLLIYFGLLFLVTRFRNSGAGVALVFALTGFLGYTLGPVIRFYLHMPNGSQIVMLALGGTAAIFLGLSAYALVAKRDFSRLGGFLSAGILVAFLGSLVMLFYPIPAMSLAISAVFVLLMSGVILYKTDEIVRGGETNYVMATVTLFVALFNLFVSLLNLLSAGNNNR